MNQTRRAIAAYLAPLADDPPTWHEQRACANHPTAMFFPERGESSRPAKAVCAVCPVRVECLTYALEEGISHGIFGGASERQRKQMRHGGPNTANPELVKCEGCDQLIVRIGPTDKYRFCNNNCRKRVEYARKRDQRRKKENAA